MEEKRREKRIKKENKLIFEVFSTDRNLENKKIHYTLTKDISLGGVNIRTDTFLPVDTLVKIDLPLPKMHKIISVRGKVRWVKSLYDDEVFEVGLEFVDTPHEVITSLIG
ncbi:MAG: PilZ domain-containing protein, partial [Candidatus Aminicenantes bacterium]|nr:PilZ domain-containing protein [Candidatus Aminicenantes bacterium]